MSVWYNTVYNRNQQLMFKYSKEQLRSEILLHVRAHMDSLYCTEYSTEYIFEGGN